LTFFEYICLKIQNLNDDVWTSFSFYTESIDHEDLIEDVFDLINFDSDEETFQHFGRKFMKNVLIGYLDIDLIEKIKLMICEKEEVTCFFLSQLNI
jgi:hypothetical protein